MLNDNQVIQFIKRKLGFPHVGIELTDEEIMYDVKNFSLKEFSYYIPSKAITVLNTTLNSSKVAGKGNEFYITEPDGLEILNVKEIYGSDSQFFIHGHPIWGALSQPTDLRNFALDVATSMMIKQFSMFDRTFEFKHPNIVRISPIPNNSETYLAIEYERQQPQDFRDIPNDLQMFFCDFALADIMIVLGNIRRKYSGNMRTPFGEIPIDADVGEKGETKKRELLDKLSTNRLLNVVVDFG